MFKCGNKLREGCSTEAIFSLSLPPILSTQRSWGCQLYLVAPHGIPKSPEHSFWEKPREDRSWKIHAVGVLDNHPDFSSFQVLRMHLTTQQASGSQQHHDLHPSTNLEWQPVCMASTPFPTGYHYEWAKDSSAAQSQMLWASHAKWNPLLTPAKTGGRY